MKTYEFGYDHHYFNELCMLAKKNAGIDIDQSKFDMVYSRLVRIIRHSKIENFEQYIIGIKDSSNHELISEFINAMTTNLTSFFREKHHFDELVKTILPAIVSEKRQKVIRIWSAGCSTGEEPYSISFAVQSFLDKNPGYSVAIYASDIDTTVLSKAQNAIYKIDDIQSIDRNQLSQWFTKGVGVNEGLCKVKPEYKARIEFFKYNLVERAPLDLVFDVIFCRNVLIYFDSEHQARILDHFMTLLASRGYLITGHSESFVYHYKKTKLIGKTIYRKVV